MNRVEGRNNTLGYGRTGNDGEEAVPETGGTRFQAFAFSTRWDKGEMGVSLIGRDQMVHVIVEADHVSLPVLES